MLETRNQESSTSHRRSGIQKLARRNIIIIEAFSAKGEYFENWSVHVSFLSKHCTCGLWGNERADFFGKKGNGYPSELSQRPDHSAKLEIKRIFRESFRLTASRVARDKPWSTLLTSPICVLCDTGQDMTAAHLDECSALNDLNCIVKRESFRLTASRVARDKPWSTLCKKSHGIPSSPRAAAVAKFRLLTGHDCLCAHLFRFNLVTSPICVLCDTGQDMTAAHLDECSALNDLNCIVKEAFSAKGEYFENWSVHVSFLSKHCTCGLWGNERADFLAKKGTGILQNFRRDLTILPNWKLKRIFRESFRLTASRVARDKPWSTLCKKSHGIPSSPRAAAVAKFRLLTGHDCLCAHLFRFNLVTSPICVLCDTGQDMTAAHLDECSALNDLNCIVKRYWRARCLMI
ncbi:uncharacterized protein LOC103524116 [Trichonephila clavipes]|nr:uncharacterized protein LOC103524116 [Trichonephila clavipes]